MKKNFPSKTFTLMVSITGALVVMLVFMMGTVLADQTVKTIDIPLGFSALTVPDELVSYNFTIDSPDGIADVISLEFTVKADLLAGAKVYGGILFNEDVIFCDPSEWSVPPWNVDNYEMTFDCTSLLPQDFDWDSVADTSITFAFMNDNFAGNVKPRVRMTYYNKPKTTIDVFGTEYQVGDNATVWVQLLDDDKQPINNALCHFDIYYPDKTVFINDGTLLHLIGSDGLYYNDFIVSNQTGVYMVSVYCDFVHGINYSISEQDSMVYSQAPTTNYGNDTSFAVGYVFGTYPLYGYVQFNISQITQDPDNISSVNMYLYDSGNLGSNHVIKASRITGSWNESNLTYNNRPTVDSFIYDTAEVNNIGWFSWDITDLAKSWLNGTYSNHGVFLNETLPAGGSFNYSSFYSKEFGGGNVPKLMVIYNMTEYITEVKGSGELHVTGYFNDLNNTIGNLTVSVNVSEISESVWNYPSRNLTYINFSEVISRIDSLDVSMAGNFSQVLAYLVEINSTVHITNDTVYDIWSFQVNELSNNLTEIQLYLQDINDTTNQNYVWLTGLVNLSADDVWNYANRNLTYINNSAVLGAIDDLNDLSASEVWSFGTRTLTDYNQTEIISLLNNINDTMYNLTIGNVSVSAYVNWTEGAVKMNNITDPIIIESQLLTFAGRDQTPVETISRSYCLDNSTLAYDRNTTRCWLDDCYTINDTFTEVCDYGCYQGNCNPEPFDRMTFLVFIFLFVIVVIVLMAFAYDRFVK